MTGNIGIKARVQRIGSSLSGMVMPNIGAFIAWGLITALFIPTGWLPNEEFNKLVSPMLTYVLPLIIGFTGGSMVYDGHRGGVVGGDCHDWCDCRIKHPNVSGSDDCRSTWGMGNSEVG